MVNRLSRMLYTGCQNTPVDSIATCVTPPSANHAASASRSSVIVEYLRGITCRSLRPSPVIRLTIRNFLWTSMPAHFGYTIAIIFSLRLTQLTRHRENRYWYSCCPQAQQLDLPDSVQSRLLNRFLTPTHYRSLISRVTAEHTKIAYFRVWIWRVFLPWPTTQAGSSG